MKRWTAEDFPVGFLELHPDRSMNFQLNRLYNFTNDEVLAAQLRETAPRIRGYADLIRELIALGERAETDGELLRAAICYRGAEFVTASTSPSKRELRDRFRSLSNAYYGITDEQHVAIPYRGITLNAYHFVPEGQARGTVVFLNGFDGYLEELTRHFLVFRDAGYEVVAFDGPGQGAVLEEYGTPMTPAWEEPTGAVFDHFDLTDVTVIGCSLGGGLAVRAAAYQPRISRLICFDVLPDLFASVTQAAPASLRSVLATAVPLGLGRRAINAAMLRAASRDLLVEWGLQQGMHVMGRPTPYDFLRSTLAYRTDRCSADVTQDVLLLAGTTDHYVPLDHLARQMRSLTNARSITTRTFTTAEHASNHCQLGNIGLALSTMLTWLAETSPGKPGAQRPAR